MWAGPCCISSHAGLDRHLLQLGLPHLLPKSGNLETKTAGFRTGGRVNDGSWCWLVHTQTHRVCDADELGVRRELGGDTVI